MIKKRKELAVIMILTFKGLRNNLNLKQTDVAKDAGISIYSIRKAEKTPGKLSVETFKKLCDFYNVDFYKAFDLFFLDSNSAISRK